MLQKKINKFVSWNVAVGSWRTKICKSYAVPCVGVANLSPDEGATFSGAVLVGFTLVRGGAGDGLPGTLQTL